MTPSLTVWTSATTSPAQTRVAELIRATRGAAEVYDSICVAGEDLIKIGLKIDEAFKRLVNMTMTDSTLHIVAVVPLNEADTLRQIEDLYNACAVSPHPLTLHILGLEGQVCSVFEYIAEHQKNPEDYLKPAKLLRKLSSEGRVSFSYSLIDNYASNGAPIGFTMESLSRYIALIQTALMTDYYSILSPTLLTAHPGDNLAIGISSLAFDREEASRQLLGHGFLAALDSVGINNKEVDAQKAAREAESILEGIAQRYPRLFEASIRPLYKDKGDDEGRVVAQASGILDQDIAALKEEILALIKSDTLSLPEKEAILAMVLGRDNENIRGMQYEHEGTLLDDACTEPIDLYVNAFNESCIPSSLLPKRGDYEALKLYIFNLSTFKYEDSEENKKAFNPLPDIKRLKQEIINTASFIRDKQDEAAALEKSIKQRDEAEEIKRKFRKPAGERKNLQHKELPLENKYQPAQGLKIKPSVDLRKFFSPVKNQEALGSCTSFAAAAMYEAMMGRAGAESADMSAAYLFYYSNVLKGKSAGGSNFFEQMEVLQQHGICYADFYDYNPQKPGAKPSAAAEEDAGRHQVIEAKQIPLVNLPDKQETLKRNHLLLTSALSEGYPIGISLKVYDNLGSDGAFILHPEDSPQAQEDGWHAMVIAGYSEENNFYIVRNSWGEEFGDQGYCYIPTAYIDDPDYLNFACIITKITDGSDEQPQEVPTVLADFAATETEIRLIALRNALATMRTELRNSQNLYAEYYRYYQRLMMQLSMPRVQNKIRAAAEEDQAQHFLNVDEHRRMLEDTFVEKFKGFKLGLKISIVIFAIITLVLGIGTYYTHDNMLGSYFVAFGILTVLLIAGYRWWVRIERRRLQEELDNVAVNARRQREKLIEMQIRFHVAGMWLLRFHSLSIEIGNVYDRLVSYNNTLRGWQQDYTRAISPTQQPEGQMFRILDPAAKLQGFFERNKAAIVREVDLIKLFENYQVNPETLDESHRELRRAVREVISGLMADFNIANMLLGDEYAYLQPVDIQEEITTLINVGQPSYRNRAMHATSPIRILMAHIEKEREHQWIQRVTPLFPMRPNLLGLPDPTTLILFTIHPQE